MLKNLKTKIDFMSMHRVALIVSLVLLVISAFSLATRGLNFGLDFTGGVLVEVGYQDSVELHEIRQTLNDKGFGDAIVQHFGSAKDVLVRIPPREGEDKASLSDQVFKALKAQNDSAESRRVEFVGPQVGEELREDGGLAMIYALAGILIYVALRFEYRFSFGAIAALVHDVVITLGFFSLTQVEFDLTVLAALLAVIGYSLNDTIVVYDRMRENFRILRKEDTIGVINTSINQMLSRTMITSLTTLLVLIALFIFGGKIINAFSIALIIGVIVGTYSSIYVASSSLLMLGVSREDLLPPEKEGEEQDDLEKIP